MRTTLKMEISGSSTFCPLARIVSCAILAVNREQSLSLGELRYNAWRGWVGDMRDTQGFFGIALAPDVGRGFVSNGRANSVPIFDLKTLKTMGMVPAGTNPDAILYEGVTKRVFAFNGRSKDATVIDAAEGKVLGTFAVGGKPEFAAADGKGSVYVNVEDTSELLHIAAQKMKVRHL